MGWAHLMWKQCAAFIAIAGARERRPAALYTPCDVPALMTFHVWQVPEDEPNGIDIFGAEDDRIEAFGTVVNANTISVCGDDSYYISFIEDAMPDNNEQATRQVTGEIIEVIGDCAFDGNCAYVVETADGEQITVIWAEGMSPICQNDPFNGNSNNDIALGDTIETLGRVIDDTTTSACGDESYYIRKV